jgi:hypothetical protein
MRVEGLPMTSGMDHAGRDHMYFDQKAFEPFVKKNDELLSKMKGICGGCLPAFGK